MDTTQEVTGRVRLARCWDRPRGHAAHERIPRCQLFSVLSVKRGPRMPSAVEGYLNPYCHVLRHYQWPE